ncbi:filamentous hemagglutinin N-terminal domain-containing protein, partial [Wolinella succinogenes]|uniref:filamentous hemagglutinin N-terminal domain-containing protein n=1 Tax=Wolinella succinogenes TaxID=844 RepID=UPI002FCB2A8C
MNIKQIISTIISFVLLHNQSLLAAELAIDASAPKANQAELIKAPNNVPIVNIVNPNSQGVSHNKFSNFNVTPQGIILNNSKAITNTELAGYISYNPKLTGSEAKLILNEVTGTKRTLLQGYTEVAGKSADIIIANPNGISVNGGGFINTPSATLTTGIPAFEGGLLRGFSIGGGGILIDGDGFNANNINKVNLYAKALEFNAKLYGDNLNIVTGENDIALDGVVSPKNKIGSGISLDSTLLGGIYANAITLQSTNKGIGVHLPPEVFAQNSLTLSANGDIVVSKAIAGENLDISSKTHSLSLTGGISANNLSLSAAKHIEIAPNQTLFASNHVTLQSDSLSNLGEINSLDGKGQSTLSVLDRLDNQGLIGGYNLNIKAKDIDNTGAIYSKNNLQVTSDTLDNSGLIRSNESIDLFIASHLTNQQEGVIYSDGDLSISSSPTKEKSNTLTNKGLIQSEKKINITANTLNNIAPSPIFKNSTTSQAKTVSRGGSNNYDIVTTTTQTEIIDIPSDPAMILASDNIHIDVNTLNNAYSLIASDENIVLNAFLANNIGKVIVTTIKTVTNQYRNERYCATSGPSGACFNHKDRAAYRGTFTSTQMERQPLANYGIQAQKSIQGNVVTLNNISSQLGDSLNDQQLQSKLAAMENLEDGTLSLQKAGTYLEASNEKALALLGADSDILDALSQVTTNEKLLNFKEGLETLKNSLGEIIEADKISIESLEATLASIRTSGILTDNVSLLVSALETSISQLKNNLATSETYLANFETIDASLAKPEDIKNHEQSLIDTNHEIKSLLIENSLIISTLDTTGLSNKFEQTSDLIRSEVNTALAQQTNVEHKIITANEGLYQTNTHHALSQTSPVSYTANNSAIIDGITLPKGKYGLFLLNKASDHPYLIESNPLYTNYQKFISSDYMLSKLDFRPENTQKRLGDAMYETQLVTQSIIKLSGNRYLAGYSS